MNDDANWTTHAGVVRAGLRRFADEGYWCWTRENLEKLLHPFSLKHPKTRELLEKLAATGAALVTIDDDACVLRILDPSGI